MPDYFTFDTHFTIMKRLFLACLLSPLLLFSQSPEGIFSPTIHGLKLFPRGNQGGMPLIKLHANEQLELHFDDLDPNIKNYYYTYILCDANWQPSELSSFDYLSGFQQQRLTNYNVSSIARCSYIHYQAILPEKDCVPTKSGNYLLKVYLDGDTSQLAFTKRLFIVSNKVYIAGNIQRPYDNSLSFTHQKLQFTLNTGDLSDPNPAQQLKVVVAQNYKWDEARYNLQPLFMRGSSLEYDGEGNCIFESGKEYRFVDLRSSSFSSYWVDKANREVVPNELSLKVDANRTTQQYAIYINYSGWMYVTTDEVPEPWWQSDYAKVTFRYATQNRQPLAGKEVYVVGELTQNHFDENSRMTFNPLTNLYEKTLLLKQGIYSYYYATKETNAPDAPSSMVATEGNFWETANDYTILVYYHSYSSRSDELVGVTTLNSKTAAGGF